MKIITLEEARENGFKHYYTGERCKNNHLSARFVSNRTCKKCAIKHSTDWSKDNREHINAKTREDRKINPEKYRKKDRGRIRTEKDRIREKNWRKNNRAKLNDYYRDRYKSSETVKMKAFMMKNLRKAILKSDNTKNKKTREYFGYSSQELKSHIERQFDKKMTWRNYGEWHIDHIIPTESFFKNGEYDPKIINALSNLRPLWAYDNLSKGSNVENLI